MKTQTKIMILFVIRVVLWITALISTGYWMWYSFQLTHDGIFDPYDYAKLLRPVLYTCLIISIAAVVACFVLYAQGKKLKKKLREEMPEEADPDQSAEQ